MPRDARPAAIACSLYTHQTACKKSLVVRATRSACKQLARNYRYFYLLALRANRLREIIGSSSHSLCLQTACKKIVSIRSARSACKPLARNHWQFEQLTLLASSLQEIIGNCISSHSVQTASKKTLVVRAASSACKRLRVQTACKRLTRNSSRNTVKLCRPHGRVNFPRHR